MSEFALKGGPHDGQTVELNFCGLKAFDKDNYGWTYECGHPTFSVGWYAPDGVWEAPETDVVLSGKCETCSRKGRR